MHSITKDPQAESSYTEDWSLLLGNEHIADSHWFVSDSSLSIIRHDNSFNMTTVWVSGGINNKRYRLTNRITTTSGLVEDKTIFIDVFQR